MSSLDFAALDFETADARPISACAVGIVRVIDGTVVERFQSLIRPPRSSFCYARLHGIDARATAAAPQFAEVWRLGKRLLDGAQFIAAHNAGFDLRVVHRLCMRARLRPPRGPFVCTQQLAEAVCGAGNGRLPVACALLGIPLSHHDPLSDAEASAAIVLAANKHAASPISFATR